MFDNTTITKEIIEAIKAIYAKKEQLWEANGYNDECQESWEHLREETPIKPCKLLYDILYTKYPSVESAIANIKRDVYEMSIDSINHHYHLNVNELYLNER